MVDIANQMILIIGIGLTLWAAWATVRLNEIGAAPEHIAEQIDDISEGIQMVTAILGRLGELMPQFHMNESPLTPLVQFFSDRIMNAGVEEGSASKRSPSTGQFQELIDDGKEEK